MQRKVLIGGVLLVLAVAVGGTAAYFTGEYIQQRKQAFREEIRSRYELTPVVVPGRDLEAGERLAKREMLVREIPRKFVTSEAIVPAEFAQYQGQNLRVPVARGTPLVRSFLGDPGSSIGGSFSRTIPDDRRALTVGVSGTSAVAGLLVPGDRVDMLIQTRGPKGHVLLPLLGNVEILATGSNVSARGSDNGNRQYRSITVEVTPEQARKITEGKQMGNLVVTLRNPEDDAPILQEATTAEDVFDGRFSDLIGPEREAQTQRQRVEIIQGVAPAGVDQGGAGRGRGARTGQQAQARQQVQAQQQALRRAAQQLKQRAAGGGQ